jgi:hypothetical protein
MDTHFGLLQTLIDYGCKKFCIIEPWSVWALILIWNKIIIIAIRCPFIIGANVMKGTLTE